MSIRLKRGDCRDVLVDLALDGVQFDACVTDPPYDLTSVVKRFGGANAAPAKHGRDGLFVRQSRGFMNAKWDGTGVAFDPATWRLVYDALKPGAHLLAFGGSRTYHRMACAIEDAGFEIRDCVMWMYGTGFPKSHDVSKGIDAKLGAELGAERGRVAPRSVISRQRNIGTVRPYMLDPNHTTVSDTPATPEAAAYEGWGTALKPAFEPIIVARKPLIGTVAENVLAHGTGALNIGACRVPAEKATGWGGAAAGGRTWTDDNCGLAKPGEARPVEGRWPANVVHDGSDEVLEAFAAYGESKSSDRPRNNGAYKTVAKGHDKPRQSGGHSDSGTAARFFYSAKASAKDRAGSKHLTVKPNALMRYLVRLVTPPGGTVLDPFCGSGSTLQGAFDEGFNAVGIEREAEYQADIQRRIDAMDTEGLLA